MPQRRPDCDAIGARVEARQGAQELANTLSNTEFARDEFEAMASRTPPPVPAAVRAAAARNSAGSPPRSPEVQSDGGAQRSPASRTPPAPAPGPPVTAAAPQTQLDLPTTEERDKLFDRLDVNGNGGLSLAEIDRGVIEMFPSFNCKPVLIRAYKAADRSGNGLIERREFRLLLQHLVYFNNLHHKFAEIDANHDRRLSLEEFVRACAKVGVAVERKEAEREFAKMDDNSGGYVLFNEFCAWCARRESAASVEGEDILQASVASDVNSSAPDAEVAEAARNSSGSPPRSPSRNSAKARQPKVVHQRVRPPTRVDPEAIDKLRKKFRSVSYSYLKGQDADRLFRRFDRNHSGGLTLDEFLQASRKAGLWEMSDGDLGRVFNDIVGETGDDGEPSISIKQLTAFVWPAEDDLSSSSVTPEKKSPGKRSSRETPRVNDEQAQSFYERQKGKKDKTTSRLDEQKEQEFKATHSFIPAVTKLNRSTLTPRGAESATLASAHEEPVKMPLYKDGHNQQSKVFDRLYTASPGVERHDRLKKKQEHLTFAEATERNNQLGLRHAGKHTRAFLPVRHNPGGDSPGLKNKQARMEETRISAIKKKLRALSYTVDGQNPQQLFRRFDRDRNGVLSPDEFRRARIKDAHGHDLSEDEQDYLFKLLDADGDGSLSVEELTAFVWGVEKTSPKSTEPDSPHEQLLPSTTKRVPPTPPRVYGLTRDEPEAADETAPAADRSVRSLKQELRARGLDSTGTKIELAKRLEKQHKTKDNRLDPMKPKLAPCSMRSAVRSLLQGYMQGEVSAQQLGSSANIAKRRQEGLQAMLLELDVACVNVESNISNSAAVRVALKRLFEYAEAAFKRGEREHVEILLPKLEAVADILARVENEQSSNAAAAVDAEPEIREVDTVESDGDSTQDGDNKPMLQAPTKAELRQLASAVNKAKSDLEHAVASLEAAELPEMKETLSAVVAAHKKLYRQLHTRWEEGSAAAPATAAAATMGATTGVSLPNTPASGRVTRDVGGAASRIPRLSPQSTRKSRSPSMPEPEPEPELEEVESPDLSLMAEKLHPDDRALTQRLMDSMDDEEPLARSAARTVHGRQDAANTVTNIADDLSGLWTVSGRCNGQPEAESFLLFAVADVVPGVFTLHGCSVSGNSSPGGTLESFSLRGSADLRGLLAGRAVGAPPAHASRVIFAQQYDEAGPDEQPTMWLATPKVSMHEVQDRAGQAMSLSQGIWSGAVTGTFEADKDRSLTAAESERLQARVHGVYDLAHRLTGLWTVSGRCNGQPEAESFLLFAVADVVPGVFTLHGCSVSGTSDPFGTLESFSLHGSADLRGLLADGAVGAPPAHASRVIFAQQYDEAGPDEQPTMWLATVQEVQEDLEDSAEQAMSLTMAQGVWSGAVTGTFEAVRDRSLTVAESERLRTGGPRKRA